ncbi:MAG: alpha/beta fold hydrolase [Myxococcota bacterium]|nr:alpha/beta fold hydrolase [Myxococcota bacterium]
MRVHVERRGSGPPIVFLHGLGVSSESWAAQMGALEDRFTVVAWDLLGHGKSPVPQDPDLYSRDGALEDLDEIVATLDQAPILVGHSLGGYLSLTYAATRPGKIRGMVLIATGPGFRDPEKREAWNARSKRNAHRFGVEPQVAGLNLQHDSLVMEKLAEIDVPTLGLAGTADDASYSGAAKYLERKMPNARYAEVSGGEHLMHEESHAAEIAKLISDFTETLPA